MRAAAGTRHLNECLSQHACLSMPVASLVRIVRHVMIIEILATSRLSMTIVGSSTHPCVSTQMSTSTSRHGRTDTVAENGQRLVPTGVDTSPTRESRAGELVVLVWHGAHRSARGDISIERNHKLPGGSHPYTAINGERAQLLAMRDWRVACAVSSASLNYF